MFVDAAPPRSSTLLQWRALAALQTSTIIHMLFYIGLPEKRDNWALWLLLFGVVGLGIGVISFSFWLTPKRVPSLEQRGARFVPFLEVGSLLIAVALGLGLRPEWIYAHLAISTTLTCALLLRTLGSMRSYHAPVGVWIVGAAVVIAIRVYSLGSFPFIDVQDEGWTLGWAVSALHSERLSDWVMLGLGDINKPIPLYYEALGSWLAIFGVGLWQARLFSFLLSLLVIVFGALAARNWYGKRAGWLTAFMLFSSAILASAARIRHDIGLAAAVAATLWLYSEAVKQRRSSLYLAAGLALGSGLLAHYHTILLAPALMAALFAPEAWLRWRDKRWLPGRNFWLYCTGVIVMITLVIIAQVGGRISALFTSAEQHVVLSVEHVIRMFLAHPWNLVFHSRLESVLVAAGLVAALWRARFQQTDQTLVLLLLLPHLALIPTPALYYYIVPLTPIYGIAVGALLAHGFGRSPAWTERGLPLTASIFLLMTLLASTIAAPLQYLMQGNPLKPYPPPAAQWVLDNVAPGSTVVSENYYFLWLYQYRFGSSLIPLYYVSPTGESTTLAEMWDQVDADVFILDRSLSNYFQLQLLEDTGYFVSRGYERVTRFEHEGKSIEIYGRKDT